MIYKVYVSTLNDCRTGLINCDTWLQEYERSLNSGVSGWAKFWWDALQLLSAHRWFHFYSKFSFPIWNSFLLSSSWFKNTSSSCGNCFFLFLRGFPVGTLAIHKVTIHNDFRWVTLKPLRHKMCPCKDASVKEIFRHTFEIVDTTVNWMYDSLRKWDCWYVA